MIRLVNSEGGNSPTIIFSSYKNEDGKSFGFNKKYQLIFGYKCSTCDNVIQALFLTEESVDQRACEETNMFTTSNFMDQKTKVFRPGTGKHFNSKYSSKLIQNKGLISAQFIKLDEHFEHKLDETHVPVCKLVSVFSFNPVVLIKNAIMLDGYVNPEDYSININNIEKVKESLNYTNDILYEKDIAGKFPDIWSVKRCMSSCMMVWKLTSFLKKK